MALVCPKASLPVRSVDLEGPPRFLFWREAWSDLEAVVQSSAHVCVLVYLVPHPHSIQYVANDEVMDFLSILMLSFPSNLSN